ncbi:MAG: hypothetical protein ACRD3B_07725 [Candidatus Sulfotelmatobacter sp.]
MLDLKSLEGGVITAIIRPFNPRKAQEYKLHKIEQYGIWVESQAYTDGILATAGAAASPKTFVAFVPWSEVSVIYGSVDSPSISEAAFGV